MKSKIQYIIFLFSSVFSFGQVTLWVAREDKVLKVNEKFTVNIILEISGDEYVQESTLKLPDLSKFNIVGTASNRETFLDPKAGISINRLVYQMVLEPKEAGKVRLGSALVPVSGKMYKTEPFDLFVQESDRKSSAAEDLAANNVYLNLEVKNRNVYTNQPTIAVLRALSRNFDNFRKVEEVVFPEQQNINFRMISSRKSEIEHSPGEIASQIIGVFVLFPNRDGKIELEPVRAVLRNRNLKLASNKVNLNVKKLPENAPSGFKNAVGEFSMEILRDSKEEPEVNKPMNIIVKMKGEGNLANMKIPEILKNQSYRIFEPKISNQFAAGFNGMKGEITAQYVLIPTKPGKIEITTEPFSYFNPKDKKYVNLGTQLLELNILSHQQVLDSKSTLEKVNEYTNNILETVKTPVISTTVLKNKEKDTLNWKIILLNVALFSTVALFFYFFKKKQKIKKAELSKKSRKKPVMTIAEEEEKLRSEKYFTAEDDLLYLQKLADQQDLQKFFSVYEEMMKSCSAYVLKRFNQNLPQYFEQNFGGAAGENYRELSRRISVEKYAPIAAPESLKELYPQIEKLFSLIKN